MTAFLVCALLLTAAVVALLAWPLLHAAPAPDAAPLQLNAEVLKDELHDLEREHASGRLDAASLARARDEVARRLIDEQGPAPAVERPLSSLQAFALVALLVPLASGLMYATRGTPQALLPDALLAADAPAGAAPGAPPPADVSKMVQGLAAKLAAQPDNPTGWAMLGRSYTVMGRYDDAVRAFVRIGPSIEKNAAWLSEYGDALSMQAGGNPVGLPEQVAQRALKLDPDNGLALMLASYGAVTRADFDTATPMIQHALQIVPADSDDARFLQDLLKRSLARQAGPARPAMAGPADGGAAPVTAATAQTDAAPSDLAAAATSLRLEVSLAPALQAQAAGRVLYVIARAPGQRMPLAVVRRVPGAWPVQVSLDAQSTLDPQRPLGSVPQVEVEARLSSAGTPAAAPDDLIGLTQLPTGRTVSASLAIDHRRP